MPTPADTKHQALLAQLKRMKPIERLKRQWPDAESRLRAEILSRTLEAKGGK